MLVKQIYFICFQAVLFKAVFTQCIGPSMYPGEPLYPANAPLVEGYNGLGPLAPIYGRVVGGNIIVDTQAPYAPTGPAGVSIFSDDLLIEGAVLVTGNLPFLGTVGLEGIIPAAGSSIVSYGCGTGNIGIPEPVSGVIVPGNNMGLPEGPGFNIVGYARM